MTGAELLNAWIDAQRADASGPRRFSTVALADTLEVSRETLNSWRRGDAKPNAENAEALARITNNAVPTKAWRNGAS